MISRKTNVAFLLLVALSVFSVGASANKDNQYTLGAKDVLEITVFDEKELLRIVEVDADGTIRFPLLRQIQIGGLTIRQAEKKMEQALGDQFLVNPHVSIKVSQYNSQKVYVLGAIAKPGFYSLTGKTTVLEIISQAGGITQQGGKELVLVRGAADKNLPLDKMLQEKQGQDLLEDFTKHVDTPPIIIDGHRLLDKGDTSLNYALEGGDILYIPNFRKVFVLGEVKRPGGITYYEGLTLLKAVTLAGGLTPMGKSKVMVTRIVNGNEQKFKVNLNKIIKDIKKDIPLLAEDVIVVPRRIF